MNETLQKIRQETLERLKAAKDESEIESLSVSVFGKSGSLTEILKSMGKLSKEERASVGQSVNAVKKELEKELNERKAEIAARMQELRFEREAIDVTEPGKIAQPEGHLHPMTQTYRAIRDALVGMGFTTYEGPEVEYDDYNFTKLNLPLDHPARDMQDTYYLTNGQLLKSQTSAAQNAILRKYKDSLINDGTPIKAIFPGRCFRNEATDACHENTFFQMEGMMVGKDISISNLIYFMKTMLSEVFQKDIKVRLRPGFFPFVEPGFELDISCLICGGEGCPSCKHSGWLELCPCGMIHPEVMRMGGIDPEEYTGFAFGLGLTRLVMMKYGIKDIRDLNGGSLKAMSQFTDDE